MQYTLFGIYNVFLTQQMVKQGVEYWHRNYLQKNKLSRLFEGTALYKPTD